MVREIPYFDRPCTPRAMVDHVLDDGDAELARDRRQEAVHLAVQLHRLHDLGAEHLQRAAVVVQLHAGRARDQPVGDRRRQPPVDEGVLAVLPPAATMSAGVFSSSIDHGADVARIVLQVAVHRDDVAPAGVSEAGREGGGLAEVAAELDDAQAVVRRLQPRPAARTSRRCSRRRRPRSRRGARTPRARTSARGRARPRWAPRSSSGRRPRCPGA